MSLRGQAGKWAVGQVGKQASGQVDKQASGKEAGKRVGWCFPPKRPGAQNGIINMQGYFNVL